MRITVIVPTIKGREDVLARVVAAYRATTPDLAEVLVPRDFPCWSAAVNSVRHLATGDAIHYGNDDLEPLPGWAEAMLGALREGHVPAPQLWNWAPGGRPVNEAADGPPGALTAFSRVPSLLHTWADAIGEWPVIDYYVDNWVSDAAALLGHPSRVTAGYGFVNHWSQVGRLDHGDWVGRSLPRYNEERAKLGLPPVNR